MQVVGVVVLLLVVVVVAAVCKVRTILLLWRLLLGEHIQLLLVVVEPEVAHPLELTELMVQILNLRQLFLLAAVEAAVQLTQERLVALVVAGGVVVAQGEPVTHLIVHPSRDTQVDRLTLLRLMGRAAAAEQLLLAEMAVHLPLVTAALDSQLAFLVRH